MVEIFDGATNWSSTETFLVFENERLSYKDVYEKVISLRAKLEAICLPGDRVAISSKNTCEWIVALVAAMWVIKIKKKKKKSIYNKYYYNKKKKKVWVYCSSNEFMVDFKGNGVRIERLRSESFVYG